ncbi:MAG TPA: hypothetical protein VHM01_21440 [Alphaproteobacteria bacterium]|nr:hypothetical protein [Alphaproteobacteria bacterium]
MTVPGELLVWTDVDPAHEADFNNWYDREHMDERVAIPGFVSARRFQRIGGGRKYLALYRTESLAVFDSVAYRQAFTNQTKWSLENFERMRDTVRCVGTVAATAGAGTGGAAGLIVFAPARLRDAQKESEAAVSRDGIVSGYIIEPDARLSTPLPGAAAGTLNGSILILEGTSAPAVADAVEKSQRVLGSAESALFQLMWRLDCR